VGDDTIDTMSTTAINAPRTIACIVLSLVAFASNSLLCRLALADHRIDAASFTAVRLASGALVLCILAGRSLRPWPGSVVSAIALFAYAAPFSYAYLKLGAGIGALVLFACVQTTMIGWGVVRGERPKAAVWIGLAIALGGLAILTIRGASAPDPLGVGAMAIAGAAWGVYSLRGRSSSAPPLATTAANFLLTVPLAALLVLGARTPNTSPRGLVLAIASGALASGIGYSLWYAALKTLAATRAAILQLVVPILAALGGAVFLGEHISIRLITSGIAIVGGVAIAIRARQ